MSAEIHSRFAKPLCYSDGNSSFITGLSPQAVVFEEDTRTPAQVYQDHRDYVSTEIAMSMMPRVDNPDTADVRRFKEADARRWEQVERATTVALAERGFFPPVYSDDATGIQGSAQVLQFQPKNNELDNGSAALRHSA